MLIETLTVATLLDWTKILGAVSFCGGTIIGAFKVISWVKAKFTSIDNNVVELKNSMDANFTGLRDEIKSQTNTIATALSEQRQDFRTFFAPSLLMAQQHYITQSGLMKAAPVKAKRNRVRKPAKTK